MSIILHFFNMNHFFLQFELVIQDIGNLKCIQKTNTCFEALKNSIFQSMEAEVIINVNCHEFLFAILSSLYVYLNLRSSFSLPNQTDITGVPSKNLRLYGTWFCTAILNRYVILNMLSNRKNNY